ncbi:hypothetical protein ASPNIDRAFT_179656 [Aspergillus niger ATCC 1015]|uniref:SnoaL-like domain-containing protein n=1 Tax=Aspergillus niger (strain ATCC 1015 / CBS 113.46 / FGSC A1144 / LSHB Ac4 / NCTC 3858a / NRRL 328 / USDA 3528.7) TaxID=380704 RepID=G3YB25_ASPNA|nr:hypothetical protein ASPNIDRAFT_179656 [Aspergillus niger ATCC 1015]
MTALLIGDSNRTRPNSFLLSPLTRRGVGPGMIIVLPDGISGQLIEDHSAPPPSVKWAEEGYTVIQICESALSQETVLCQAVEELAQHDKCTPNDIIGLIAYGFHLWESLKSLPGIERITAAVVYAAASNATQLISSGIPTMYHLAGKADTPLQRAFSTMQYDYPNIESQFFALPNSTAFDYATEGVSHTRSLTFLKKHMNGPFFDLEVIWEEHTYFEFDNRSVEQTMATMVQERYVNHIPTMTGGIGRDELTRFYRDHFIFNNPPDTKNELISRTIGIDRVVDKFIMTFTHDSEVDWLIPGIPPTGRKLEIPFMAVVNIRGDRLYHEHITWYQATVLKQLGLMPEFLPFPYPLTGGKRPAHGRSFEVRAPVAGAETAAKMRHKSSVPSNQLFEGGIREV